MVAHTLCGREVNCTDCHTSIGPDHREGAPEVVKYRSAQSQPVEGFPESSLMPDANSQCIDCHKASDLREASWTHAQT